MKPRKDPFSHIARVARAPYRGSYQFKLLVNGFVVMAWPSCRPDVGDDTPYTPEACARGAARVLRKALRS
jgi:hypothetical protein